MSGADIFLGQIRKGKTRGERNRSVFCDVAKEGAGFFPEAEHPHTAGLAFCLTDPEQNEKEPAKKPADEPPVEAEAETAAEQTAAAEGEDTEPEDSEA